MYLNYYRLRAEPFGITPDPRFLFLSAAHREALAALVYGVTERKGFISIVGEVGTGKTIILRTFLERIDQSRTTAICILNPLASFEQIVEEILPAEFEGSTEDRFRTLQEWLIEEYRKERNVVVVIDEAQRIPPATLERLRLLSNLETADQKLIQIVLAGQPELEEKLEQPMLRQVEQRIAVRATIWPLSRAESVAYIHHRVSKVLAPGSEAIFTRAAVKHLVRCAKGNPRRLNILCDNALLAGFGCQKHPVTWKIAQQATSEAARYPRWRRALAERALPAAVLFLAAGLVAGFVASRSSGEEEVTAVRRIASVDVDRLVAGTERAPAAASRSPASRQDLTDTEPAAPAARSADREQAAASAPTAAPVEESSSADDRREARPVAQPSAKLSSAENPDARTGLETAVSIVPETVVVNDGDGLWQLCREVYGVADAELVSLVMGANPHIRDPNNLVVGEELSFPRVSLLGKPVSGQSTKAILERR